MPEPDPAMPELEPCPWCGAPGEVVADGSDCITEGWIAWGFCRGCGCRGPVSAFHRNPGGKPKAIAEAAGRWDSRLPHPDAARLDLVEREQINLLTCRYGWFSRWVHRGWEAKDSEIKPTARAAIDSAAKALGED